LKPVRNSCLPHEAERGQQHFIKVTHFREVADAEIDVVVTARIARISEADVCVAFAARIHQQPPDSVRLSNLGNGFNQFERNMRHGSASPHVFNRQT
jgi:hypothetical protein